VDKKHQFDTPITPEVFKELRNALRKEGFLPRKRYVVFRSPAEAQLLVVDVKDLRDQAALAKPWSIVHFENMLFAKDPFGACVEVPDKGSTKEQKHYAAQLGAGMLEAYDGVRKEKTDESDS